jgi:hypothetical protein
MKPDKTVICNKCGWVHFQVSLEYVQNWEKEWGQFWRDSTPRVREAYGCVKAPPSREQYLKCFRCDNNYKNFRDTEDSEIPFGSTIQPILDRTANES